MIYTKLNAVVWAMFLISLTTIGLRAIRVYAAQPGPQAPVPPGNELNSAPPVLLAAAEQQEPIRKPEAGIDPALAGLVDGRVVETTPITKDCMILSYLPEWAHGEVDNLGLANNDGGVRVLLNWQPIPTAVATRSDRRFLVALYSRKTDEAGKVGPLLAFEITADWPELTSWRTQPDYAPDPAAQFKFVPDEGWKLFDITSVVRSQATRGGKNHGLLLRWLSEDRSGQKRDWSGYQFVSREGAGEWRGRRPQLLVVEATKK